MRFRECPICGAALDPGEKCDCQDKERGRPAGTGTTSEKGLPRAVYQPRDGKSSRAAAHGADEIRYERGYHMKIKSLRLENFQGIAHAEFNFDGLSARIYGDNATGKSTVFNAYTWLLFDKASTGAKNFTPKTKGPDGDLHNLEHSSEASFIMDTGETATFKKVYHEVYKKKRGSATEVFDGHTVDFYIDGVPVREKQYTSTLQDYCGGIERMKMLTMPDYFAETMQWDDRRKILLELCGDVTDVDVIESNEVLSDLVDFLRKPGSKTQFYSVEEYKKIAAARKTEINKQLQALPGRIDEAQRAIPDGAVSLEQIEANIRERANVQEKLLTQRAALLTGDTAITEARKRTAEAEAALAGARSAYAAKASEANAETMAEINRRAVALSEAQSRALAARASARDLRASVERMTAQRQQMYQEYSEVQAQIWDEAQETCPTCGQRLPLERIDAMKDSFNQRRSERLTAINERGKAECSGAMIEAATRQAEEAEQTAALADADAGVIQSGIDALRSNLTKVPAFENTEDYFTLAGQIAACRAADREAALGTTDTSAIDGQIRDLALELETLQKQKAQHQQAETQRQRIAELEADEKRLGAEYENLDRGVWLCDEFTKAKVKMLTDRIDSKFTGVRFRLFQEQLNGGVKDDCEVLVPGDGGRMVPYPFANNAARINAGLEIIGVLAAHWDMEMPVFIDNAESVTHLARTWTQTIRLVVSEQDKQLRLALD